MLVTAMATPQHAMTRPVAMRPVARQYDLYLWPALPWGVAGVATPWDGGMISPSSGDGGCHPLASRLRIVARLTPWILASCVIFGFRAGISSRPARLVAGCSFTGFWGIVS